MPIAPLSSTASTTWTVISVQGMERSQHAMSDRRLILRGGDIVTPAGLLPNATLDIDEGLIAETPLVAPPPDGDDVRWITGLVVPGFVDLHSDALEREVRPRPTSVLPAELALLQFDRTLAAQGITTMFHAIAFAEEEGARHHP